MTARNRRSRGPRCNRDGCRRSQAKGQTHCTQVCQLLDHEFVRLESVCRQAGPGAKSTEAWASLVEIADAWSEYEKVRGIVNHIATRPPLALRGLPPPTPRPGREAFHSSIVAGNHPRITPIRASGAGSKYRPSVSGLTPPLGYLRTRQVEGGHGATISVYRTTDDLRGLKT